MKKVLHTDSSLKIFIETHPAEQSCPCCGCKTKRVHDYRTQEIDDIPFQGKLVTLVLRKRRHFCTNCGKRFFEHYSPAIKIALNTRVERDSDEPHPNYSQRAVI